MQVGWIGLGTMGAPMAARLARCGHSVHGYDVAADRKAALAADGCRAWPRSPRRSAARTSS
jgi:3-hydroxyisobutyrate dehydrogenase